MEHDAHPTTGADGTPAEAVAPAADETALPAAPDPVVDEPVVDEPIVADPASVPETELLAALRARHAVLASRLARAEEENLAFVRSLRHAAAAAEELLAEATAEADAVRAGAEADAGRMVAAAQARAVALIEAAVAEATELVAVARADARDAQAAERATIEEARTALATVEASIAADRAALVRHHAELTAGLRSLARAMGLAADEPPTVATGSAAPVAPVFAPPSDAAGFAETVRTGPGTVGGPDAADPADDPAARPEATRRVDAYAAPDEEHLERAFDEFFSSEIEHEPSRAWIFEE